MRLESRELTSPHRDQQKNTLFPFALALCLLSLAAFPGFGQTVITTVAGNGTSSFSGDGGPATNASLNLPTAVVADRQGNIYVADQANNRIRKITSQGTMVTVAGNGVAGFSGDGGPATNASLNLGSPSVIPRTGLALDSFGNLYIADADNGRIRKVTPDGIITTVAGRDTCTSIQDGVPAIGACLWGPTGVAVDNFGNFYIADLFHHRIRKVSASGIITTVAGNGVAGFAGDGGPAIAASLDQPRDVAVDVFGNLYIADYWNNRIRKVTPNGSIATVAGSGAIGPATNNFSGDGAAAIFARLSLPTGVAVDLAGTLYIADTSNHRIRRVGTEGIITTEAGGGSVLGDGGLATTAGLSGPRGVAAETGGILYIADTGHSRIRKVQPDLGGTGPLVYPGGAVNGASFARAPAPISPGSIVTLFGSGLATGIAEASAIPLPINLRGTQVLMNGRPAPLIYVSPGQVSIQVPWEVSGSSSANVQVTVNGIASQPIATNLAGEAPGVFTISKDGMGPGVVVHAADGSPVTSSNPAQPGEYLTIYCTGLGVVTNPPATGSAARDFPLSVAVKTPVVTLGGVAATVEFAGLAPNFVGLYQINIRVPEFAPAGAAVSVVVNQGGNLSNVFTTAVANPQTSGAVVQLTGAFNFAGLYPLPAPVNYTSSSGQTLTSIAYPGQIFLVVSPLAMDVSVVTSLVRANNGLVIAQIPGSGLYWVRVEPGTEAAFISTVRTNPSVIFAGPNVPLTGSQAAPVNLSGATSLAPLLPNANAIISQFDLFAIFGAAGSNVCGLSHGEAVDALLIQNGQTKMPYDLSQSQYVLGQQTFSLAAGSDIGFGLARAAEGALERRQKFILNVSLQGLAQPNDGQDRRVCETNPNDPVCSIPGDGNYASWKTDEFSFLVGIASAMQHMRDDLRNNTLLVISAGNSGLDLTREIALLRSFFPKAFPHMLVVGSTGANGEPHFGHNHSTDPTAMLYAPGIDVRIPDTGGCRANGTSFAAPQVANLAAQLAQRYPNLTTAQLVQAIMNAARQRAVNGLPTMPTVDQVVAAIERPSGGPLTFRVPSRLPDGTVGVAYSYSFCDPTPTSSTALCGVSPATLNPTGGAPPYHFQLDSGVGFPPFGVNLNLNGILSGTPTAAGTRTFRVCAVDTVGESSCQTTSLTVNAAAGGIYAGNFTGESTSTVSSCTWKVVISGRITANVSGSGTPADPYRGTATANATNTQTVLSGPGFCQNNAGVYPINASAPVSGSAGRVEWHGTVPDLGNWDFEGGVLTATTLSGTLTISSELLNASIVGPLTMTKQ